MTKPVALVLLNWNTAGYTADCITSLLQYCDTTLFDIIITDNGSTDNSLSILRRQFPHLIYIDNQQNLGFAEGNNRALAYSLQHGYTYSLLLNTDTLVDEDIVYKLSTHLNDYPQVAAVQPAIYWMHEKSKIWNGKGRFNQILGLTKSDTTLPQHISADSFEIAEWVTGCCMLIRNTALVKNGLFTERFFLYFEDVDLSFRLREAGYELHYLPSCKMYHEAGVSAKKGAPKKEGFLSPVIHYYISRNHIWILRRYGKPVFYPVYLLYNGLYYLALRIYFKLRSRNEKAASLMKGLKDGLFTPKALIWRKN